MQVDSLLYDKPSIELNFETLKKTATDTLASGGHKPSRPLQHYEFIQWLEQKIQDKTGKETILEPVIVSRNHSRRINFEGSPKDPCPVDQVLIQRLVTRIGLKDHEIEAAGEKLIPCFAIAYSDDGIEVSFGSNVWMCANMNIFGSTIYRTYGKDKVSFEDLQQAVLGQINTFSSRHEQNSNIVKALYDIAIPVEKQRLWEAEIFETAVRANKLKTKDLILNLSQTTRLTEELLRKRDLNPTGGSMTAWDFTQAGTEHLKPISQDMVALYPTVEKFNTWVIEKAELPTSLLV